MQNIPALKGWKYISSEICTLQNQHAITPKCLMEERRKMKGRKERHDFAFRVVFAVWNTCVSRCARGAGDVIEGCCAFESRRLCWMCGGASINSYWFRCRLRTPPPPPPPPPQPPFLLSSSVTERQPYRQPRIILIAFELHRETPDRMEVWAPTVRRLRGCIGTENTAQ